MTLMGTSNTGRPPHQGWARAVGAKLAEPIGQTIMGEPVRAASAQSARPQNRSAATPSHRLTSHFKEEAHERAFHAQHHARLLPIHCTALVNTLVLGSQVYLGHLFVTIVVLLLRVVMVWNSDEIDRLPSPLVLRNAASLALNLVSAFSTCVAPVMARIEQTCGAPQASACSGSSFESQDHLVFGCALLCVCVQMHVAVVSFWWRLAVAVAGAVLLVVGCPFIGMTQPNVGALAAICTAFGAVTAHVLETTARSCYLATQMRYAQELDLIALTSHELRNPLNGVVGSLRLLLEELDATAADGSRLPSADGSFAKRCAKEPLGALTRFEGDAKRDEAKEPLGALLAWSAIGKHAHAAMACVDAALGVLTNMTSLQKLESGALTLQPTAVWLHEVLEKVCVLAYPMWLWPWLCHQSRRGWAASLARPAHAHVHVHVHAHACRSPSPLSCAARRLVSRPAHAHVSTARAAPAP